MTLPVYSVYALLVLSAITISGTHFAQSDAVPTPTVQVFVIAGGDGDTLLRVDPIAGTETRVVVNGTDYSIVDNAVVYFDRPTRRVRVLSADGAARDHPFMQMPERARRIDWTASADRLAWTVTRGDDGALITDTFIAAADGRSTRLILNDGPRDGIRAYPVAFTPDNAALLMDYQPDAIGDITPLRQYAGLFALDLETGMTTALPGEPGCFCGAGFGAGWFLRLTLAEGDFAARAFFLAPGSAGAAVAGAAETMLTPIDTDRYIQGGGFVVSPDGRRAIYALVRLGALVGSGIPDETLLVSIDLTDGAQRPSASTIEGLLRPVAWADADSVLLTDRAGSTWKWRIDSDDLARIAQGAYIGTIGYN
ncbi:MAG: hypothetical protein SGJ24_06770 [Chloroflexota bacterium]|nr:hypothetical protein [Chloroflexota bacterium]